VNDQVVLEVLAEHVDSVSLLRIIEKLLVGQEELKFLIRLLDKVKAAQ
jgi:hypothetical protein